MEDVSDRVQISYNRTRAPWPVADRDVVLRGETTVDVAGRRVVISFHSVDDPRAPRLADVVRIPSARGHWILTPERDGRATRVEYQLHAEAGGSLPGWIANVVSRVVPQRTLLALRGQVKRRRYPRLEDQIEADPGYRALLRAAAARTSVEPPRASRGPAS